MRKTFGYLTAIMTALSVMIVVYFVGHKLLAPSRTVTVAGIKTMSTVARVTAEASGPDDFVPAFEAFAKVEHLCNVFDPHSELSNLNASAAEKPFMCSPELYEILTAAREAYRVSEGGFDITAGPLMKLWGFRRRQDTPQLPTPEEIAGARKSVGLDKVKFDDAARSVYFTVPGMSIDLGGIAKGWAADRAAKALDNHGITRGMIDLGGNLRSLSEPVDSGGARVAIRDPLDGSRNCGHIRLRRGAVATSGNYERFVEIGGKRYAHIMDPATGMPVEGVLAVTVVAPTALQADWLSTTVFVRPELAEPIVLEFPEVEIWVYLPSGDADAGYVVKHYGRSGLLNGDGGSQ